jgi:hypothetical protein
MLIGASLVAAFGTTAVAQKKGCEFPKLLFCIDNEPLTVRTISGLAGLSQKDAAGSEKFEIWPDLCVSLFTAKGTRLVRSVRSNDDGKFVLKGIADGYYWLVVQHSYGFLTPARVRIRVDHRNRNKIIRIHLVPSGIDTCSWAELT